MKKEKDYRKWFLLMFLIWVILAYIAGRLDAHAAGLEVTLSASPAQVKAGEIITYSAVVKNTRAVGAVIPNFSTLSWVENGITQSINSNTVSIQVDNSASGVYFTGHIPTGTALVPDSVKKDGQVVAVTISGQDFPVGIGVLAPQAQVAIEYKVVTQ